MKIKETKYNKRTAVSKWTITFNGKESKELSEEDMLELFELMDKWNCGEFDVIH